MVIKKGKKDENGKWWRWQNDGCVPWAVQEKITTWPGVAAWCIAGLLIFVLNWAIVRSVSLKGLSKVETRRNASSGLVLRPLARPSPSHSAPLRQYPSTESRKPSRYAMHPRVKFKWLSAISVLNKESFLPLWSTQSKPFMIWGSPTFVHIAITVGLAVLFFARSAQHCLGHAFNTTSPGFN